MHANIPLYQELTLPKLILSIDGVVIKEVELTQERTTLGRRPRNDIVIEHLAVSGDHAVLHWRDGAVELEDLDSTNGSFINGKRVQRQRLASGDLLEMGKHQIRFLHTDGDASTASSASSATGDNASLSPDSDRSAPAAAFASAPASDASFSDGTGVWPSVPAALGHASAPVSASVEVLNGHGAGRKVALSKVVTTVGKPGTAVASITRRHHGFVLAHVEGPERTVLNGTAIGSTPLALSDGDLLELGGTQMRFVQT